MKDEVAPIECTPCDLDTARQMFDKFLENAKDQDGFRAQLMKVLTGQRLVFIFNYDDMG